MNRSIQALTVLVVSLAGAMLAITWVPSAPVQRVSATHAMSGPSPSARLTAEMVSTSSATCRYQDGCGYDRSTGKIYGCGVGIHGTALDQSSVNLGPLLTDSLHSSINGVRDVIKRADFLAENGWSERLIVKARDLHIWMQEQLTSRDEAIQRDYAAAELAAAGLPAPSFSERLTWPLLEAAKQLEVVFQSHDLADNATAFTRQVSNKVAQMMQKVGLADDWNAIEKMAVLERDRYSAITPIFSHDDLERWFENFPAPITEPSFPLQPHVVPKAEDHKIILATANVMKSLASLIQHAAENLERRVEQDVAELHTPSSPKETQR